MPSTVVWKQMGTPRTCTFSFIEPIHWKVWCFGTSVMCNTVLFLNNEECLIFLFFRHLQRQFISQAKLHQSHIYNKINIHAKCFLLSASFSSAILFSLKIQYFFFLTLCIKGLLFSVNASKKRWKMLHAYI